MYSSKEKLYNFSDSSQKCDSLNVFFISLVINNAVHNNNNNNIFGLNTSI